MLPRLTGSLLIFFCICKLALADELRPYRLINADTLFVQKTATEYISNLIGNVHFFYGETEFFADKADIFEKQKIARLEGNVEVYDDSLSLFAQNVEYQRIREELYLKNDVFLKEDHQDGTIRTFKADSIAYYREQKEINAYGNVMSFDERENISGRCGRLYYFMNEGYGYLIVNPVITMASKDSIQISAEKIEYFEDFEKVVANFNVKTLTENFEINSDFLLFFNRENKALYLGNPRFMSEFADARASEFQVFFDDHKITKATLLDSCFVEFKTEDSAEKNSWVRSREMQFDFQEGRIRTCNASVSVSSYFEQTKSDKTDFAINSATGQRLVIKVDDENKIESIDMRKSVQGLYKFEN
jgi:lipopolysaccharide export system protein LptA